MEGWIKLHREIMNHWIYKDEKYFKAWMTILMTVNHEPKKILVAGELIDCGRGQSLLSLQSWCKLFGPGWSIQKIRTFFNLLKNDTQINIEGLRKTTRLTVCNYDKYQNKQQTNNTENNTETNKEITTTKEGLRRKKKERDDNFYFSEEELRNAMPENGTIVPETPEQIKEMEDFLKMLEEKY